MTANFEAGGHRYSCLVYIRHPGRQDRQADRGDEPFRGRIRFAGRPRSIRSRAGLVDLPHGPQTLRADRLARGLRIHGMRRPAARTFQRTGRNDRARSISLDCRFRAGRSMIATTVLFMRYWNFAVHGSFDLSRPARDDRCTRIFHDQHHAL